MVLRFLKRKKINMPKKEVYRREDILNKEYREWVAKKGIGSIYPALFPEAYKQAAINAMDENAKRICLELLEYMAKNDVECEMLGDSATGSVIPFFYYKGEFLTKEQLFENFL